MAGAELTCSSATGEGIEQLKARLFERIAETPAAAGSPGPGPGEESDLSDYLVYRPRPPARREFRLLRDEGSLRIAGRGIEALAAGLDPDDPADVARLAAELERLGVEDALRAAGVKTGAEIMVGSHSFTFQPAQSEAR